MTDDPNPDAGLDKIITADLRVEWSLATSYAIRLHHDLRPYRLRPWWATLTHGIAIVGEPGSGVWHARSPEKLIAKLERWIARDMLCHGLSGDASITVYEPDGQA